MKIPLTKFHGKWMTTLILNQQNKKKIWSLLSQYKLEHNIHLPTVYMLESLICLMEASITRPVSGCFTSTVAPICENKRHAHFKGSLMMNIKYLFS